MYANIIVSTTAESHKIYVGSAWGGKGLERRIRAHQNPVIRQRLKHVYHYEVYDTPGNVANFVPLVVFPDKVPMPPPKMWIFSLRHRRAAERRKMSLADTRVSSSIRNHVV